MLPTQNEKVKKEILKMRCTVKWFDAKKGYGIISTKTMTKQEKESYQKTVGLIDEKIVFPTYT